MLSEHHLAERSSMEFQVESSDNRSTLNPRLEDLRKMYGELPSLWHGPDHGASNAQRVNRWVGGLPVDGPDTVAPEALRAVVATRGVSQTIADQKERLELALATGDEKSARAALFTLPAAVQSVEPVTDILLIALQREWLAASAIAVIEKLALPKDSRVSEALKLMAADTSAPLMNRERATRLMSGR